MCDAYQRAKLEQLCRYITRPPVATKRLFVDERGRSVYRYNRTVRGSSTHMVLESLDFIARLAALVPRPRLNLNRFHVAVLAPMVASCTLNFEVVSRTGGEEAS